MSDESAVWRILGFAVAGAALYQWWKKGSIVEQVREATEAATYEGSLPQDAPGVGTWEEAFGAGARIFGFEEAPKVETTPDLPAEPDKGPFLGTPRNALRVAGKVRYPANGTRIDLTWGTATIEADAAIENQAAERRLGQVRARIIERKGDSQEERIVDGPFVDLAPGEFRDVRMRVPLAFSGYGTDPDSSQVSLLFAGYTLDTSVFERD